MCCFSQKVDLVTDTNIFARPSKDGKQYLVYSMKIEAGSDLAMILPIPTPRGSAEDAVRFISLEKYADFFEDMKAGFPAPPPPRGFGLTKGEAKPGGTLKVFKVGSFLASFVPSVPDFERLDKQFRLPSSVWDRLPMYGDYGFAVFKLKKGAQQVHPMAFEFPRANPRQIFFPTVHIHDGTVKARAAFHHALYCQKAGDEDLMSWEESAQPASLFMKKIKAAQGIVDPEGHCYRRRMVGVFKNEDILV